MENKLIEKGVLEKKNSLTHQNTLNTKDNGLLKDEEKRPEKVFGLLFWVGITILLSLEIVQTFNSIFLLGTTSYDQLKIITYDVYAVIEVNRLFLLGYAILLLGLLLGTIRYKLSLTKTYIIGISSLYLYSLLYKYVSYAYIENLYESILILRPFISLGLLATSILLITFLLYLFGKYLLYPLSTDKYLQTLQKKLFIRSNYPSFVIKICVLLFLVSTFIPLILHKLLRKLYLALYIMSENIKTKLGFIIKVIDKFLIYLFMIPVLILIGLISIIKDVKFTLFLITSLVIALLGYIYGETIILFKLEDRIPFTMQHLIGTTVLIIIILFLLFKSAQLSLILVKTVHTQGILFYYRREEIFDNIGQLTFAHPIMKLFVGCYIVFTLFCVVQMLTLIFGMDIFLSYLALDQQIFDILYTLLRPRPLVQDQNFVNTIIYIIFFIIGLRLVNQKNSVFGQLHVILQGFQFICFLLFLEVIINHLSLQTVLLSLFFLILIFRPSLMMKFGKDLFFAFYYIIILMFFLTKKTYVTIRDKPLPTLYLLLLVGSFMFWEVNGAQAQAIEAEYYPQPIFESDMFEAFENYVSYILIESPDANVDNWKYDLDNLYKGVQLIEELSGSEEFISKLREKWQWDLVQWVFNQRIDTTKFWWNTADNTIKAAKILDVLIGLETNLTYIEYYIPGIFHNSQQEEIILDDMYRFVGYDSSSNFSPTIERVLNFTLFEVLSYEFRSYLANNPIDLNPYSDNFINNLDPLFKLNLIDYADIGLPQGIYSLNTHNEAIQEEIIIHKSEKFFETLKFTPIEGLGNYNVVTSSDSSFNFTIPFLGEKYNIENYLSGSYSNQVLSELSNSTVPVNILVETDPIQNQLISKEMYDNEFIFFSNKILEEYNVTINNDHWVWNETKEDIDFIEDSYNVTEYRYKSLDVKWINEWEYEIDLLGQGEWLFNTSKGLTEPNEFVVTYNIYDSKGTLIDNQTDTYSSTYLEGSPINFNIPFSPMYLDNEFSFSLEVYQLIPINKTIPEINFDKYFDLVNKTIEWNNQTWLIESDLFSLDNIYSINDGTIGLEDAKLVTPDDLISLATENVSKYVLEYKFVPIPFKISISSVPSSFYYYNPYTFDLGSLVIGKNNQESLGNEYSLRIFDSTKEGFILSSTIKEDLNWDSSNTIIYPGIEKKIAFNNEHLILFQSDNSVSPQEIYFQTANNKLNNKRPFWDLIRPIFEHSFSNNSFTDIYNRFNVIDTIVDNDVAKSLLADNIPSLIDSIWQWVNGSTGLFRNSVPETASVFQLFNSLVNDYDYPLNDLLFSKDLFRIVNTTFRSYSNYYNHTISNNSIVPVLELGYLSDEAEDHGIIESMYNLHQILLISEKLFESEDNLSFNIHDSGSGLEEFSYEIQKQKLFVEKEALESDIGQILLEEKARLELRKKELQNGMDPAIEIYSKTYGISISDILDPEPYLPDIPNFKNKIISETLEYAPNDLKEIQREQVISNPIKTIPLPEINNNGFRFKDSSPNLTAFLILLVFTVLPAFLITRKNWFGLFSAFLMLCQAIAVGLVYMDNSDPLGDLLDEIFKFQLEFKEKEIEFAYTLNPFLNIIGSNSRQVNLQLMHNKIIESPFSVTSSKIIHPSLNAKTSTLKEIHQEYSNEIKDLNNRPENIGTFTSSNIILNSQSLSGQKIILQPMNYDQWLTKIYKSSEKERIDHFSNKIKEERLRNLQKDINEDESNNTSGIPITQPRLALGGVTSVSPDDIAKLATKAIAKELRIGSTVVNLNKEALLIGMSKVIPKLTKIKYNPNRLIQIMDRINNIPQERPVDLYIEYDKYTVSDNFDLLKNLNTPMDLDERIATSIGIAVIKKIDIDESFLTKLVERIEYIDKSNVGEDLAIIDAFLGENIPKDVRKDIKSKRQFFEEGKSGQIILPILDNNNYPIFLFDLNSNDLLLMKLMGTKVFPSKKAAATYAIEKGHQLHNKTITRILDKLGKFGLAHVGNQLVSLTQRGADAFNSGKISDDVQIAINFDLNSNDLLLMKLMGTK
ncbi:MAG: hypothetical protein HeimC3_55030, partial [Candidatus Heimdallarchaeota archaeon LC_3]